MKRIGITFGLSVDHKYSLHMGYPGAIIQLGGIPMMYVSVTATPTLSLGSDLSLDSLVKEFVSEVDALLVSGGWDVEPSRYGQEPQPELEDTEPVRDIFESAMIEEARRQGKKVLAICRGVQILNVTMGGTLHQDLVTAGFDQHQRPDREYQTSHSVIFEPGSVLAELMDGATEVNTLHHQGIDCLGEGLRAVAYSPDGVIEAVEGDGILGIQWHPERLYQSDPRHLAGFRWLMAD
ncbi:MAG: gamma-glutamyl-gamma-aminobutyrate hydrolase family protein [Actinomycetota bacterium]|nr:gamma-glutamyl-gamma-aminobutyrate hydrolase family protein [Actinomycetota bacterium]